MNCRAHIDSDGDGGPTVAQHRVIAALKARNAIVHDIGDGESFNDVPALVVTEVNGGLQFDLLDVAFAIALGVRLVTLLRYGRSTMGVRRIDYDIRALRTGIGDRTPARH